MSSGGRGRGESKKVQNVDDEFAEADRQAQMGAARVLGISESEIPIRGRGGFRSSGITTIPSNVTQLRASNTAGERQVDILANYVQILPMPQRVVHMYRVDYEPQVESASRMRFLFREAGSRTFTKLPIFDGAHECRTGQRLTEDSVEVNVVDPRLEGPESAYRVRFTHTGTAAYGSEMLRIYNMHMKDFLKEMGFYSPQVGLFVHQDHSTPISAEIMMLRGFRTSANEHDGHNMLMNLEGAHKLLQRKNVLQQMSDIRGRVQDARNLREALRSELVGKVVVTSYNKRIYRIEDLEFSKRPGSTFEGRNGEEISFVDYFKQQHGVAITDLQQPMLKVVPNNTRRRDEEPQREILLVPELCNQAGLTNAQRADNRLKMDMIRASQVKPDDRVQQMRTFIASFHENREIRARLADWGYNYDRDAVRMKAHVVAPTKYATGNMTREPISAWPTANPANADIQVNQLAVVPEIKKLAIIMGGSERSSRLRIMGTLKMGFDRIGLRVGSAPHNMELAGNSAREYIEAIRHVPQDCDMAIVVLQSQNKERYDAVKKAASVERGLITQVVTARLMEDEKKSRSAAQKIAIQIAAKVGGEPWWVDIPMKRTMVCGYDTYHDTAQRGRSYGAFVASLNSHYARWWSKADAHDRLEEISAQISANISEAFKCYGKYNNAELPERVIIYRDGVGEGQLEHVYSTELKQVKRALDAINDKIKLTFIVVNKRIGARFYKRAMDNKFTNPEPGTVVDHTVTRQERYDFFLISQSTRQGTVSPTYYNIIHDEGGFPPDIHQKMAFKMSLLYYNWMGTVRVPAPCQYAHKLALLCGEHLHAQPNSVMDDKLHFL